MNKGAITGMAALATLYLGMPALRAADNKVIWLDEMNLTQAVSGWGGTQAKKTVDKKPLTLRKQKACAYFRACIIDMTSESGKP
jgi:hypothetical protein